MATTKSKRRKKPPARVVQHPKERRPTRHWWPLAIVAGALAIAVVAAIALTQRADTSARDSGAELGLPNTPDYHSLLVSAGDPQALALGTHYGLYGSSDGGRSWQKTALDGQDAMNLAPAKGKTVWAAGHNVLARSSDGGRTWQDVRPDGLPHLDIHGFAVDARDSSLWAALAGDGLYRSKDGGASFRLVTRDVGAAVMALVVTDDGRILAGDMKQGLMVSADQGRTWRRTLEAQLMGLAINPRDPERIVATGPGILLSTDGGRNWRQVLRLEQGAGPVAWAVSVPDVGYAVGFDRTLYKTTDRGQQWKAVS